MIKRKNKNIPKYCIICKWFKLTSPFADPYCKKVAHIIEADLKDPNVKIDNIKACSDYEEGEPEILAEDED